MTTQEVADRYMELNATATGIEIQQELYDDEIECIEPPHAPMGGAKGKAAVMERLQGWYANVAEMHESKTTQPVVMGNYFSLGMMVDLTTKDGTRQRLEEMCLYEVRNGKIVKEQYFY